MKAIVVGRHAPDFGADADQFEVLECRNVQFPASRDECRDVIRGLVADATAAEAVLLLQNVPAQLGAALADQAREDQWDGDRGRPGVLINVGIIVSVPGPRLAGVSKDFNFDIYELPGASLIERARELALFCNGRAKIEMIPSEPPEKWWCTLRVTVDPIPQFVFSHIEWL